MSVDITTSFSGKRVLITGGFGFIGSNLAHRLVGLGADVCLVDSSAPGTGGNHFNIDAIKDRVQVVIANIRDAAAMRYCIQDREYLFNLAGHISHIGSMQNPNHDLELNCSSHLALLELCREHNPALKIVYASTRQIYGRPAYLPVDEKHPLAPVDFNGISKMAGEWYHTLFHRVYGLHTTSLRMTNVYGPRMWAKDGRLAFIGLWLRQMVEGQELLIYGDGTQIRDFNFVEDVLDALLFAAADTRSDGQIYNLGSGQPINLLDLARLMVKINGSGGYRLVPFPVERKRIDIGDYFANYAKIQTELGWQPKTPLREGLACALDYYHQFHEHYW
jgi:UDP-glucose 4-epimerase